MGTKTYQRLAGLLGAIANNEKQIETCNNFNDLACQKCAHAQAWIERHQEIIDQIMQDAPSGSGFDNGTQLEQLEVPTSNANRLIFKTAYHHVTNDMYDGWTEHVVSVVPSLQFGFSLKASGKDRNNIKEYIHECFNTFLDKECEI
jgi:hypothetical protein